MVRTSRVSPLRLGLPCRPCRAVAYAANCTGCGARFELLYWRDSLGPILCEVDTARVRVLGHWTHAPRKYPPSQRWPSACQPPAATGQSLSNKRQPLTVCDLATAVVPELPTAVDDGSRRSWDCAIGRGGCSFPLVRQVVEKELFGLKTAEWQKMGIQGYKYTRLGKRLAEQEGIIEGGGDAMVR